MVDIPLDANVEATDGHVGKSTHIIFNPQSQTVTHFVVNDENGWGAQDRLVPIEKASRAEHNTIFLNCSKAEIEALPHFSETSYLPYTYEDYSAYDVTMGYGYGGMEPPVLATSVTESIPDGLSAIYVGADVEAKDGQIGQVGDLILDENSGKITHFTLKEGHLWGKKKVTLPISVIDSVSEDFIKLKLSKKDIEILPGIAIDKKFEKPDSQGGIELIGRVFDTPEQAEERLKELVLLQRSQHGSVKIRNAAVLVKDADGKLSIRETADVSGKRGGWVGAIGGGLLGALAGPVGIVIGAATGAGVGRVSANKIDMGFSNEFLDRLQKHLEPNHSALLLLVEHQYLNDLNEAMANVKGIILQQTLTDLVVNELLNEHEASAD